MSGIEPAVGSAVHFTDIIAGAIYQAVVSHLPRRQMKAGDNYMAHAFDVIEKHRMILPADVIFDLSQHYRVAEDSTERYSRAKSFLRSWRASRFYKVKAKATMKLAEVESSKARAKYLFASQVADQFARIVEDQSTETLTSEEIEHIHSKVVKSALELALSVPEGETCVEVSVIAVDTAKLACQVLRDQNAAAILPKAEKEEGADAEKTLEAIAE